MKLNRLICLRKIFPIGTFRNFLYRDMKCEMICLSQAAQFPVLNGRKRAAQHFMNQETFHSTFPILVITKIFQYTQPPSIQNITRVKILVITKIGNVE